MNKDFSEGIFDSRKQLGWPKTLILGLQQVFAMFGATVLVPMITGLSISVTLLCAGVGTLIFHLITKGKVPAFLGSSFAFLGGFAAVTQIPAGSDVNPELLPYALGGVVAAGGVYVIVAGLIKLFGIKRVMQLFPPVVTGPIIVLIGLILSPSAVANASTNWLLAVITIAIIIISSVFGKGMLKILPILLGVFGAYLVALIMGEVNLADAVSGAAIVGMPPFMLPKFELGAILTMAPIALATMMEHIGDISSISATCKKNYLADPGLHRSLLGDGIATSFAGLIGGPANTTYGENTGVLVLTKVFDPFVIRIAAVCAIVLGFSPLFDRIVGSIPTAIVGGASFMLYGMISAIGVRNMVENKIDLTNSRNLIIVAMTLVSGLGINAINGINIGIVTLSGLACAAISGIVLNLLLPGKDYEFSMEDTLQED
jgi:uracil permease